MRFWWAILAFILFTLTPGHSQEGPQEDWIGIGDLEIVDVHHTAEYIGAMNGTGDGAGFSEGFPSTATPASLAGRWSLTLRDREVRNLDLTLFQIGTEIFGTGTMTTFGGSQIATATGSMAGDVLDLRLVSVGDSSMYRLRLDWAGGSVAGSYTGYSPSGAIWFGTAIGGPVPMSAPAVSVYPPDITSSSSFKAGVGMG